MRVRGVTFVGTRAVEFDATVALFRDVLGMEEAFARSGHAALKFGPGDWDLFEVFAEEGIDERLMPSESQSGIVVAFVVDDVAATRAELDEAGVELIGELVWVDEAFGGSGHPGVGWCFFRAPDAQVYALQQIGLHPQ